MAMERSQVSFGSTAIPYVIRRSPKRSTVSIAIDPAAGVLVTAPRLTPTDRLDRVVRSKARWIVEHLRRQVREAEQQPTRELVNGETLMYLGRQYRLRVVKARKLRVVLTSGRLTVLIPDTTQATVKRAVVGWYRHHAAYRLRERVALWAKKMGIPTPAVLIRDQRRRWGSCDPKGNLRFNWRIIQTPMRLVDYVVAHELVHLEHRNHTPAFWSTLGNILPDSEVRRQALRRLGAGLEW